MRDTASMVPRVELQNIQKTFGAVQSLRGVNLKVYPDLSLWDDLDVASNLFLGREPVRVPGFIDRQRMHEEAVSLLSPLGITIPSTHLPVRYMSGLALGAMIGVVNGWFIAYQ